MMDDDEKTLRDLERVFETARRQAPSVPPSLARRVVEDARAVQPRSQPRHRKRAKFFERVRLGQWAAISGLVAASSVGFWIGIDPPVVLQDVSVLPGWGAVSGEAAELSGFGWELEES